MQPAADRVVLDTDVVSRLLRGTLTQAVTDAITGATLLITFVTVGELIRGATHAKWGARRLDSLESRLNEIPVIPADTAVARSWGTLTGRALRAGSPLPANDAWIAACCITHAVPLATYNVRDFSAIDGLRLLAADGG